MPFFRVILKKRVESSVKAEDREDAEEIVLSNVYYPVLFDKGRDFWDEIEVSEE